MKKIFSVIIALILLICAILPISSAYDTTTYRMLSANLALISDSSGVCMISYQGGDCHIERLAPNAYCADLNLDHTIAAAGVFGNTAVALCNDVKNNQLEVYTYRMDTDILDSFAVNDIRDYGGCGFFYDDSGLYLVSDRDTGVVEQYSTAGVLLHRYSFNSAVSQLGRDYSGNAFAVSAKTLYRLSGSRFNALKGSGVSVPVTCFSDDLLSDAAGNIYRIRSNTCAYLFSTDAAYGKSVPCIIDDTVCYPCGNQISGYLVDSGVKTAELTLDCTLSGVYSYRGYVCAVSAGSVPTVCKIRLDEFTDLTPQRETVRQENNPAPDNSPTEGLIQYNDYDTPDYLISSSVYNIDFNNYRISGIPSGTTFAQLEQNILHDGYEMQLYRDGIEKSSGNCGTAMTVVFDSDRAIYTFELSVIGDITGEGNVNSRDLHLLMEYLIDTAAFNGVYLISADLSNNGVVDVKDLALLHRMI